MKPPRTTNFTDALSGQPQQASPATSADPTPASPPPLWRETAAIVASLLAVLDAVELAPKSGPAVKAYQSAMRRQGDAAAALGGHEAMEVVLRQIAEADPARADARTTIVRAAWAGLPKRQS